MADDDSNFLDYAWGKLVLGAVLLGLALWLNSDFKAIESGARDSVRMNWIFALLYRSIGRLGTVAITGVAGAIALLLGLRQLLSERN